MGNLKSKKSEEAAAQPTMDPSEKVTFTLDASGNGCSGMFWRTKPSMSSSSMASDWPRNGAKLQGWKSAENPGWVRVDHPKGFWLPEEQRGKKIIFYD
ncbi:hypothetical protein DUNSADRAFT_11175 [Dunaliella salina]|uniref:Encoded protein n=1 Tax=Dunaliella salina TaxID=3046 RepID=A0ABQ7GDZ9_DUNSA|nr:hypothetical protein DUNSADRAFT_11175 [Dunaliella salina]|eukprot:KAF5832836.1 hypothetical protein DUNSADRAFT_11175 [Dunaliella salina]